MTAENDAPVAIHVDSDVLVRMVSSDMLIDAGFRTDDEPHPVLTGQAA